MITARALEAYFKRKEKERQEREYAKWVAEGRAEGRAEVAAEANAWLRRREEAEARGEDFDEPPPFLKYKKSSSDTTTPIVGAAVVAGGESRRMGGVDKLFAPVLDKPLLLHCLEAFQRSGRVHRIAVAAGESSVCSVRNLAEAHGVGKLAAVVQGGARRQDSVSNALDALGDVDVAVVHDGARPFVDGRMIADAVDGALEFGAATAAVPVKDTIKVAGPDMTVAETPPREGLWAAQTPQAFRAELLREAHRVVSRDVTDDAAMVEALGYPVRLFMGAHSNIKVTTPEDLTIAEAIGRAKIP